MFKRKNNQFSQSDRRFHLLYSDQTDDRPWEESGYVTPSYSPEKLIGMIRARNEFDKRIVDIAANGYEQDFIIIVDGKDAVTEEYITVVAHVYVNIEYQFVLVFGLSYWAQCTSRSEYEWYCAMLNEGSVAYSAAHNGGGNPPNAKINWLFNTNSTDPVIQTEWAYYANVHCVTNKSPPIVLRLNSQSSAYSLVYSSSGGLINSLQKFAWSKYGSSALPQGEGDCLQDIFGNWLRNTYQYYRIYNGLIATGGYPADYDFVKGAPYFASVDTDYLLKLIKQYMVETTGLTRELVIKNAAADAASYSAQSLTEYQETTSTTTTENETTPVITTPGPEAYRVNMQNFAKSALFRLTTGVGYLIYTPVGMQLSTTATEWLWWFFPDFAQRYVILQCANAPGRLLFYPIQGKQQYDPNQTTVLPKWEGQSEFLKCQAVVDDYYNNSPAHKQQFTLEGSTKRLLPVVEWWLDNEFSKPSYQWGAFMHVATAEVEDLHEPVWQWVFVPGQM